MAIPQFGQTPLPKNLQLQAQDIEEEEILLPEDDVNLNDGGVSIEEQTSIEEWDHMPERNEEGFYRVDDMLLDEGQYRANFGTEEERQAIHYTNMRWPDNTMQFIFHSSVPDKRRAKIRAAIAAINKALDGCFQIK